jgi:hypothetical protein
MTVYVLAIGYDCDVIRVFTTKEAAERAADRDHKGQPMFIATAEVEEL